MSSSPAAAKVVVEYAKSDRSLCEICSKSIASGALRLGMVSKDPRGFDMTKWHHLNCFPSGGSSSISPAESIAGFSSLKSSDRDFLNKLKNEVAQASNKVTLPRRVAYKLDFFRNSNVTEKLLICSMLDI